MKFRRVLSVSFACLVLSTSLSAAYAAPRPTPAREAGSPAAAAAPQFVVPVSSVNPSPDATAVRPDVPFVWQLDATAPTFARIRNALERGNFEVWLNGEPLAASYDPTTHTITANHANLARYTSYELVLTVKEHPGQGGPTRRYVSSFMTGSALHEPTHVNLDTVPETALVTEGANVSLSITDDYGLPAEQAVLSGYAEESGTRLANSATVPSMALAGTAHLNLTDREAERVTYHLHVSGPYTDGHDDHDLSFAVQYRPGPVTRGSVTLLGTPAIGRPLGVVARVADAYGNPVPGQPVRFASSNANVRFDPSEVITAEDGTATTTMTPAAGVVDVSLAGPGFAFGAAELGLTPVTLTQSVQVCTTARGVVGHDKQQATYHLHMMPGPVTVHQEDIISTAPWSLTGPNGFHANGWESNGAMWVGGNPVFRFTIPEEGDYDLTFYGSIGSWSVYDVSVCYQHSS